VGEPARTGRRGLRTPDARWLLIVLALLGAVLSIFGARRDAAQFMALARLRFEQAVDSHVGELQSELTAREVLMSTAAALFNPGEPIRPGALGRYGRAFLALSPEVTAIAWLPAVPPERVEDALSALRASGIVTPVIFGRGRRPLDVASLGFVPHVILDIEPKQAESALLGGSASDWPERRYAIAFARSTRRVITPGPTVLFQPPNPYAFLLYAPVFDENGTYLGALSFSYEVSRLFPVVTAGGDAARPFSLHIYDTSEEGRRDHLAAIAVDGSVGEPRSFEQLARRPNIAFRSATFGAMPLTLAYVPVGDPSRAALRRSLLFAGIGLGITAALVLTVWLILENARRLSVEVAARRSAEERLHLVIQELNHRVRNALTVAQSIILRSLRPGMSLEEAKETVTGRYQALATVLGLLTESDWQGASLRTLLAAEMEAFAGRYRATGEDLWLKPRAAQTITLVLHELATNSAKHGALSTREGQVEVEWGIDGGPEPTFVLRWRDRGGPPVAPPTRRGFGTQILERVAPQDLGGRSELTFAPDGLRFELSAPLAEIDGRGDRFSRA
jgi:two-component sensor histidine kinase/CHASE1-domain containing sensor protein